MKIFAILFALLIFSCAAYGQNNCTYSVYPYGGGFDYKGGTQTVTVTTQTGCAWTATSNDGWVTISAGASGTGNGAVTYSVEATPDNKRTGSLTVAGINFPVNQSGIPCTYTINAQDLPAAGGPVSITKSNPGCIIEERNQESVSWIAFGVADRNYGPGRGGILKFNAGPTVGQNGGLGVGIITTNASQVSGCDTSFSLVTSSAAVTAKGANAGFDLHGFPGCAWQTAVSADWITVNLNPTGQGSATIGYSVAANSGAMRTGTITVAGQTFTITQDKSRKRVKF